MDIKDKILNKYPALVGREDLKEKIIDCKVIAEDLKEYLLYIKCKCINLDLVLFQVGEDKSSESYFKMIESNCKLFDIEFTRVKLSEDIDQIKFEQLIYNSYRDKCIMIHTPLPKKLDTESLYMNIDPKYDVDCVTEFNLGRIFTSNKQHIIPCTVSAIMNILKYSDIDIEGKKIVILGRSMTVGKPLSSLLEKKNGTVSLCHSKTPRKLLIKELKSADIIISAVGQAKFITSDMISNHQILIDVGINFDDDGKMCGDIDFENVLEQCKYITPVPFGVGAVTNMCLIENIFKCKGGI